MRHRILIVSLVLLGMVAGGIWFNWKPCIRSHKETRHQESYQMTNCVMYIKITCAVYVTNTVPAHDYEVEVCDER